MKQNPKALLALVAVCLIWGTTYYALRIGVAGFPAFLFSGIRQVSAGLLLVLFLAATRRLTKLTWADIGKQAIPGVLMITIGNGVIGWAEIYIPSGLAALIVAIMPVYVTLINLFLDKGTKPNLLAISGILVGAGGIALIFRDNLSDLSNPNYFWGVIASFLACLSWAVGSVYMKRNKFSTPALTNAALQFTSGGILLMLLSLIFDDYATLSEVTVESLWSLAYLTLFGSIVAYLCFLYALEKLPLMLVSTYAYVNPVIAIVLGWALLSEKITPITLTALSATLAGVWLVNRGTQKAKQDEK
ncbi:EamA family transporter [Flavobacterium selenitireducens]|uniref:EamA family transporter n=1 Tax=Flavobacterium selenitireducens TaxID=2722704 RepID=UPI00168BD1DB|nr:EamA family transporter [Flavobacterium selenitireducens]MBD3581263.1 EamA family transporter [Flavobacterium selenitireducens]